MKSKNIWGVLLIALGIVSLCYAGITYTRRKTILQVGSLVATTDKDETIPLPPVVGVVCIVAGIAVLALGRDARV